MAKSELVATRGFKYMTRRLLPGDTFEARNDIDAMILTKVRKVAEAPKAVVKAPAPVIPTVEEVLCAEVVEDDLTNLRAAYFEKFDKRPYHGWDADTLREKMAE